MNAAAAMFVALGGAVGAVARHVLDRTITPRTPGDYPSGILVANLVGSFVLGLVTAMGAGWVVPAIGVGFCGALTTYSTVAASTWAFAEERRVGRAVVVITATVVGATLSAWVGMVVGAAVR